MDQTADSKDTLGDKLKAFENASKTKLDKRIPIIIRLDGKAFHSLTRVCHKPYDYKFVQCMLDATEFLCKNVQGVQLGYTQSDEISLLLVSYQEENTQAWFDAQVQKICSVSAAYCAVAFNESWRKSFESRAFFDSRVFNLPKENVNSYFVWRQNDCIRNSILSLGLAHFSSKELHKHKTEAVKILLTTKGIIWENEPNFFTHGSVFINEQYMLNNALRSRWIIDHDAPLFVEDKNYVNKFVFLENK
jgi:tRNA(His) guanylyltransferase